VKRIFELDDVPADLPSPVVTLGAFDGVHLGHQKVLADTLAWARELGGTAVVVTFRQLPRAVTDGGPAPCITSLQHRLVLIEQLGIDLTLVLDFTADLAAMPAETFVRTVFCQALGATALQWGFNCHFGRNAEGDIHLLQEFEKRGAFRLRQSQPVELDGKPVSSTAIRQAITAGRLDEARRMLGRPVALLGTVISGEHRGRALGFPTANLDLDHEAVPPPGIYLCRAIVRAKRYTAVANIGPCPSFVPPKPPDAVEVHILDFDDDIHGEDIQVEFLRFLRPEQTFDTPDDLVAQMRRDVALAREMMADS